MIRTSDQLDSSGFGLSGVGDVNDDGIDDFAVVARHQDGAGKVLLVFGNPDGLPTPITEANANGRDVVLLTGMDVGETGASVSGVGDVNDDGIDDFVWSSDRAPPNRSGRAYLVFGSDDPWPFTLPMTALNGSNGVVFQGPQEGGGTGFDVSGLGDISDDGVPDFSISSPSAEVAGTAGMTHVVFGDAGPWPEDFDLMSLDGTNGFQFLSENTGSEGNVYNWEAGDLTGDGIDDLLFAVSTLSVGGTNELGQVYIIPGDEGPWPATVTSNAATTVFRGHQEGMRLGSRAFTADVNGDGLLDVVTGASAYNTAGRRDNGGIFVFFGRAGGFPALLSSGDLDGENGFTINGLETDGFLQPGRIGDVNADGFDDLLLGAFGAAGTRGRVALGYGGRGPFPAVRTSSEWAEATGGFIYIGKSVNDRFGVVVDTAGDVNGDGVGDFLFSSYWADPVTFDEGETYLLYGVAGEPVGPGGGFDLALTKELVTPGPFREGDLVTFEITVLNQGGVVAGEIEITDYIPAGLTVEDSNWTQINGISYVTEVGPLAPGESITQTITCILNANGRGDVLNIAEISRATDILGEERDDIDSSPDGNPLNDGPVVDNVVNGSGGDEDDHDTAVLDARQFDLALIKVPEPGPFAPGGEATFTITVFNQGNMDAANIVVTDQLPEGLTLNDSAWTDLGSGAARIAVGSLAVGRSTNVTITANIATNVVGEVVNLAEISAATDADGNRRADVDSFPDDDLENDGPVADDATDSQNQDEDDHDSATINVEIFDLALENTVTTPGPFLPGNAVTFAISVSNEGNVPAANILVTQRFPPGLILVDPEWTDNEDGTATRTVPGTILPGVTFPLTASFVIENNPPSELVTTAEVTMATDINGLIREDIDSTSDTDPLERDDLDPETLMVEIFDLALRKVLTTPGIFRPGDTVSFEITVINQGTVTASTIRVIDYIPAGLTLADAAWESLGSNAVRTIAGPLEPDMSTAVTIDFTVAPGTDGERLNVAEIERANDADGNARTDVDSTLDGDSTNDGTPTDDAVDGENGDQDDHDIAAVMTLALPTNPDLALTKVVQGSGPFASGGQVTFLITVFNQGDVDASEINIVDYIPTGLTLTDSAWTDNGNGTASFTLSDPLAPDASADISITFLVNADAFGSLVNEAEITGAIGPDGLELVDIDGPLDADRTNNGTPVDDAITDPLDIDHHDPAMIIIGEFDLALLMTLNGAGPFQTGDDLIFSIQVINQGSINATDILLRDTLPAGLLLNDPDWTDNGDGTASFLLPSLIAGATETVQIATTIEPGLSGMVTNIADIAAASGPDGNPLNDIDSVVNLNTGDILDDVIDGTGGDEDDQDPAFFEVVSSSATLTGTVWIDINTDADPNENLMELGLEGIPVTLSRVENGGGIVEVATVSSDAVGFLSFGDQPPGEYITAVDTTALPVSLTEQTTPTTYRFTVASGGEFVSLFGFSELPTAVTLSTLEAERDDLGQPGVTIRWTTASESDVLGFHVYRVDPTGRSLVTDALVLAGVGEYAATDATGVGGTYILAELTTNLETVDVGEVLAFVAADPQGEGIPVVSEADVASFTTGDQSASYLVTGFSQEAIAVDTTDAAYPLELRGETLDAGADHAVYFQAPAAASIEVTVP